METRWTRAIVSAAAGLCACALGAQAAHGAVLNADREEARLNQSKTILQDPDLERYLLAIGNRLISSDPRAASFPIRVHVLENRAPFVFALDNGATYVSTGLLGRLQNESQLASMLATELAVAIRKDDERSDALKAQRAQASAIPNVLLVTITAGLAGFPLLANEKRARDKIDEKLQLQSDTYALGLLQKAGFDVSEAPRAFERLRATLEQEGRFGSSTLSSKIGLQARINSVKAAMTTPMPRSAPRADAFLPLAKRFAIELARSDLNSSGATPLQAVLDRYDHEFGPDGQSSFIRAEAARQVMHSQSEREATIHLYEACIAYSDAPAAAYRELGFLYRQNTEPHKAHQAFASYLERAGGAADAPIIRSYLEKLND